MLDQLGGDPAPTNLRIAGNADTELLIAMKTCAEDGRQDSATDSRPEGSFTEDSVRKAVFS